MSTLNLCELILVACIYRKALANPDLTEGVRSRLDDDFTEIMQEFWADHGPELGGAI